MTLPTRMTPFIEDDPSPPTCVGARALTLVFQKENKKADVLEGILLLMTVEYLEVAVQLNKWNQMPEKTWTATFVNHVWIAWILARHLRLRWGWGFLRL